MTIKMILLLYSFRDLYIKLFEGTDDILNLDIEQLSEKEQKLLEILEEYDYIIDI